MAEVLPEYLVTLPMIADIVSLRQFQMVAWEALPSQEEPAAWEMVEETTVRRGPLEQVAPVPMVPLTYQEEEEAQVITGAVVAGEPSLEMVWAAAGVVADLHLPAVFLLSVLPPLLVFRTAMAL